MLLTELTNDDTHIADLSNIVKQSLDSEDDDEVNIDRRSRPLLRTDTIRSDQTQILHKGTPDMHVRKQISKTDEDGGVATYEVLASDQNTERKHLQNINLTPESMNSVPIDNKEAVFHAYKTIEKLQDQLM